MIRQSMRQRSAIEPSGLRKLHVTMDRRIKSGGDRGNACRVFISGLEKLVDVPFVGNVVLLKYVAGRNGQNLSRVCHGASFRSLWRQQYGVM